MTAIAVAPIHRRRSRSVGLAPLAPATGGVSSARPHLVVIEGGRVATAASRCRALGRQVVASSPSLPRALAVAVVLTLAAGVAALVVATTTADPVVGAAPSPAASLSTGPGAGVMLPDEAVPVATRHHIVQPGDTLWGIATSLQGEGDVRPLVDELARRAGPGGLQPGQRLSLDGLVGR